MATKQCKQCNTVNPALNQFCAECGSSLEPKLQPISTTSNTNSPQTRHHMGLGSVLMLIIGLPIVLIGLVVLLGLNAASSSRPSGSISADTDTAVQTTNAPAIMQVTSRSTSHTTPITSAIVITPTTVIPVATFTSPPLVSKSLKLNYSISAFVSLPGQVGRVSSVAFSPDGKALASASYDTNSTGLWEVSTGKNINTITDDHSGGIARVIFSPDGKTIASGSLRNSIKLWEVSTGKLINTFTEHSGGVESVAFSPDGKTLASSSRVDNSIKLWEVSTGKLINTLYGSSGFVFSVAFSPDGKTLASGNLEYTINLWEVSTGRNINTLKGHSSSVYSVTFSPNGKILASASGDSTIKLWEVSTGKNINTITGHSSSVYSVAFSPDGKTLASVTFPSILVDSTIKLWEANSGREIFSTTVPHGDTVWCLAFSPDGKYLVSGHDGASIKLWDVVG